MLISVLRGVEVIIFYMVMMGSIKTLDFVIGHCYIIFTLLFKTVIRLIPIYFRVLSILIFIMAFKMLGLVFKITITWNDNTT